MKNLKTIALILIVMLLSSATTVQVMKIVPETPKSVVVKAFIGDNMYKTDKIEDFITNASKTGYIVKHINSDGTGMNSMTIVVMEKY